MNIFTPRLSVMGAPKWLPMLMFLLLACSLVESATSQVLVAASAIDASGTVEGITVEDEYKDENSDGDINTPLELANAQLDWLVSKGGYFAEELAAIQPISDDEVGGLGIFATTDLKRGDLLMRLPMSIVLRTDNTQYICDAALTLLGESEKTGNLSSFAPYLNYIYSTEVLPSIPSTWSSEAKLLLDTIQGSNLFPNDMTEISFFEDCVDEEDELGEISEDQSHRFETALAIALSRSWDEKLIPVLDMINHHPKYNVGTKTMKDAFGRPEFILVFASEDVLKGEQLYTTYQKRSRGSTHHAGTYLQYFGIVEDFPQRWRVPTPHRRSNIEENQIPHDVTFEVLRVEDGFEIKWEDPSKGLAHPAAVDFLEEELSRIKAITETVRENAESLSSGHERETILDYHWSMMVAYETLIADIEEALEKNSVNFENEGDNFMACADFEALHDETYGWKYFDGSDSAHQRIDYFYNLETRDACLFLEQYLHACVSNRPHYHEVFVHYPAHFLEKVERVLFIGGGDSMVLHEVLKYDDQLELVVGLELDQQVVRSTYSRIGTQPHFDNDKVEWWFGDAAEALNILPTDYYGTFDLVVVDILSEVAESLKVTDEVTIMEAAMMLMQPNGIIVKNEDEGYVPGSTKLKKFTDYTVDVMYYDVPVYCLQTFVVGSNAVNFFKAKPKDHNISNFYLKNVDEFQAQFDTWYTTNGKELESGDEDEYGDDENDADEPQAKSGTIGVAMIIDAEDISIPLISAYAIQEKLRESIETVGFTRDMSFEKEMTDGYMLFSVLKEGIVSVRCFPEKKYCAIDIQLWKDAHLAEPFKKELISVLQSQDNSVYRVVTTGVFGVEKNNNNDKIGPPAKNTNTLEEEISKAESEIVAGTIFEKRKDPTIDFKNATFEDYDSVSALEQYYNQEPLADQTIVKFDLPFEYSSDRIGSTIRNVFLETLGDDVSITNFNIGDGILILTSWSEGSIVSVWDGALRLDMNIFVLESAGRSTQRALGMALAKYLKTNNLDVFPRGTGRVINFRHEFSHRQTGTRVRPFWAPPVMDHEDFDEEEE